jgi:hypothetical protein
VAGVSIWSSLGPGTHSLLVGSLDSAVGLNVLVPVLDSVSSLDASSPVLVAKFATPGTNVVTACLWG